MENRKAMIKIELDGYCLGTLPNGSLFISRPNGEGMEIGRKELKKLLEQYLKDNF